MSASITYSRRVRPTPFTSRLEANGVSGYTVYNRMLLPTLFAMSLEDAYWHLREHVQIWDVSCERQVEITGPDAARLVQLMTPRDLSKAKLGRCYYAPIIDQHAGMLNDPMIIKLADDRYWVSIADSDILLYAKGLAIGLNLSVEVVEPDVSPLAIQGPKSDDLMASVFGEEIRALKFFGYTEIEFMGRRMIVSRSGYSSQGGFEIYLNDSTLGPALWDTLWDAGSSFSIAPGCPNLIDRLEGGLLSYGNDIGIENNPLEVGLEGYCHHDRDIACIGRDALRQIAKNGPKRLLRWIHYEGDNVPVCRDKWPLMTGGKQVGILTSTAWSPRLKANVAVGQIDHELALTNGEIDVMTADGRRLPGRFYDTPFRDFAIAA